MTPSPDPVSTTVLGCVVAIVATILLLLALWVTASALHPGPF